VNGFAWYDMFGGAAGIACWVWIGVLAFLMICAWAVIAERTDNPQPVAELARLAPAIEPDEWTPEETLR